MEVWIPAVMAGVAVLTLIWKFAEWKGKVDEQRGTVAKFMDEIRSDIKNIFDRLPPAVVTGKSPLHLTDFGEKIAIWMSAATWAAQVAPALRNDVQGKQPFEIDEIAGSYVQKRLSTERNERVRKCAYEFGIPREGVLSALKIVLRDELIRISEGEH